MIWLGLSIVALCVAVYFGIEPLKKYIIHKREIKGLVFERAKIERDKLQAQNDLDRIQREVEMFAEEQRRINLTKQNTREEVNRMLEENRRRHAVLKQVLPKKDYEMYMWANREYDNTIVRGGHGNKKLTGFEHGWYRGSIDDKNCQREFIDS
jgi:glycyl-tRNA synthetase alpha subunit